MDDVLLQSALIMGIGLIGCILPAVPGPPLVWIGAMYHGYRTDWSQVGWPILAFLFVLAMIGSTADTWMGYLGARKGGASIWSSLAGSAGGIIGLIAFSLPGAILGSLLAIGAVEWYRHRNWNKVLQAGKGYAVGYVLSIFVELGVCLAIIGIWVMALKY
ncbi:MAG: uncharacterized protein JWN98_574 [Abditibacteriota bacterium]|nr:uncharacterized protein [Abditibacteriota bacterium]